MRTETVKGPDFIPVLSRGKHRSPKRGACFMEFASYLAGEHWSDHPKCTHPLLGELARLVNDHISDEGRARLVPLIPTVIGLTGNDPHIDARIALGAARRALPVASAERQRVLALGVYACERALASLDGQPAGTMSQESRDVLAGVPEAERWARRFLRDAGLRSPDLRPRAARRLVRCSVEGVAVACISDPDAMLEQLVVGAIADFGPRPAAPAEVPATVLRSPERTRHTAGMCRSS
ncbi:MAG: hypothetical protein ACTHJ6_13535 [Oryzihumus sp.]